MAHSHIFNICITIFKIHIGITVIKLRTTLRPRQLSIQRQLRIKKQLTTTILPLLRSGGGGQEKCHCDNCDFKTDKDISIKIHITAMHNTKPSGRKRKSMELTKVQKSSKED